MKVILNLHNADAKRLLQYLGLAVEDYAAWLQDVSPRCDRPEAREDMKKDLRLLRKLRRQLAPQVERALKGDA